MYMVIRQVVFHIAFATWKITFTPRAGNTSAEDLTPAETCMHDIGAWADCEDDHGETVWVQTFCDHQRKLTIHWGEGDLQLWGRAHDMGKGYAWEEGLVGTTREG